MAILFCNDLVPTSGQATALRESGRRPVPPLLDLPGAGAASPSDDSAGSADDGQLAEVVPSKTAPEISQADWLHGSATRKAVSLSSRGPPRRVMPAALPSVAAPFSARARAAREPAAEECGVVYDALWEDWSEWLRPVAKHPAPGGGSARASASSSVAAKAGGRPRMGVTLPSLLSREESATGSSFWPRSAAAGSLSLRSATSEAQWRRPGSQLTGRLAMADSSSLPQQYSLICKEDVTRASSRRDVDSRSAAARRRDCAAQQGRLHRKRAARWRGRAGDLTAGSSQSLAPEPPFPGQDDQEDQLQDELEGDASSAQDGYPRWKRAFDRIQQRSPAEGPAAGPSAARDAAASRQPERAAPRRSDPRPRSRSTSKGRSGSKGDSVHRSPDRGEEARRPSRGMPPSAAAASLAMSSVGGSRARADSAADIANSFISSALSNKNLAWKKRHVSLDSHIESLSRMKKIEERVSKLQRIHDARKRHFFQLPEEERELYQTVFMYTNGYTDPHDCTLDAASVRVCAVEVGLGGIGSEEQVAVLNACEQAARSPQQITCAASQGVEQDSSTPLADIKTGVTLYTFACVLVPALRRALHALRAERLEDLFDDRDVDHSGSLAMDACCDLVRVFAGSRADAATVREHAAVMFAESPPEEHGLRRVSMEVLRGAKNNRPGGTFSSVAKAAAGRKSQLPEPPRVLNSEQLGRLVDEVCEATRRRCHQQERHLQAQAHLDGATFAATRPDLPLLQRIYQRHAGRDADQEEASAGLTVDGCLQVLLEFGLRGSGMRLDAVMHLVEQHVGRQGEGLIHFKGLLDLVEQVRRRCEHTDFEPLEDRFVRFAAVESRTASAEAALAAPIDRRESGSRSTASGPAPRHIPLVSVAKFVDQTRCLPRRRELPDAVAQVVEEHLTYSTSTLTGGDADVPHGTIHFPAMVRLLQRVSEYVGRLEFQREAKAQSSGRRPALCCSGLPWGRGEARGVLRPSARLLAGFEAGMLPSLQALLANAGVGGPQGGRGSEGSEVQRKRGSASAPEPLRPRPTSLLWEPLVGLEAAVRIGALQVAGTHASSSLSPLEEFKAREAIARAHSAASEAELGTLLKQHAALQQRIDLLSGKDSRWWPERTHLQAKATMQQAADEKKDRFSRFCSALAAFLCRCDQRTCLMGELPLEPQVSREWKELQLSRIIRKATEMKASVYRLAFLEALEERTSARRLSGTTYALFDLSIMYELRRPDFEDDILSKDALEEAAGLEGALRGLGGFQSLCGEARAQHRGLCDPGLSVANYRLADRITQDGLRGPCCPARP
ncbi:unnamed protein product [Prorocentrum cordatum]|uniref:EF-hand domain-containing protein n=1 Tax=Prorocentrum cordatum TaxID=2364126 RepID=A0ABN9TT92_9DINO|nr:unnamed protein product [Polarella glacialis]